MGVAVLACWVADRDSDLICLLSAEQVMSAKLWLVVHRDLFRTVRVRGRRLRGAFALKPNSKQVSTGWL